MKGSPEVLEQLNKALREELTAINQYFLHAEMCENWGYDRLSEYIKMQSIGEMKHAESLMERILFLDGIPNMKPLELTVGKTVKDMIQSDLELELAAVKMYNEAIRVAVEHKDNGSTSTGSKLRSTRSRNSATSATSPCRWASLKKKNKPSTQEAVRATCSSKIRTRCP